MVGPPGLEPGTNTLWVYCSNQLSYRPYKINKLNISFLYFYQLKIAIQWWAVLVTLQLPLQCQQSDIFIFVLLLKISNSNFPLTKESRLRTIAGYWGFSLNHGWTKEKYYLCSFLLKTNERKFYLGDYYILSRTLNTN